MELDSEGVDESKDEEAGEKSISKVFLMVGYANGNCSFYVLNFSHLEKIFSFQNDKVLILMSTVLVGMQYAAERKERWKMTCSKAPQFDS